MGTKNELAQYIRQYFGAADQELEIISSFFHEENLAENEFFLRKGRRSDRMAFLRSGIIREWVEVDGKEITKWISTQGYFIVDLSAFLFDHPSRWNLQALEDCELYVIEAEKYNKLGSLVPRWTELEKLFLTRCFSVLEDRVLSHLAMNAEERYRQLYNYNKKLFINVPLHYLASMLGMTPETFSRIRKKILEEN